MRKRMSPDVMKKLVYIRYQKKYKHLIKKLGIVIDPEELSKAISNDTEKDTLENDSDIEGIRDNSANLFNIQRSSNTYNYHSVYSNQK